MTGAGIANTLLGVADVGLTTMTEIVDQVRYICQAVSCPVVSDADTGYGNAINLTRTVREFERAGAAGIHIEDQVTPKRCGHFEGKQVISRSEMVNKIRAAVDSRRDPDFVLIARTDARAVHGLDDAIERALAYREAGADVIFVEAPRSEAELQRIGTAIPGPLVANMVEDGLTPILPAQRLQELGFRLVIYANLVQRAAVKATQDGLRHLRTHGTSQGFEDRIISMAERNRVTGLAQYQALERKYLRDT